MNIPTTVVLCIAGLAALLGGVVIYRRSDSQLTWVMFLYAFVVGILGYTVLRLWHSPDPLSVVRLLRTAVTWASIVSAAALVLLFGGNVLRGTRPALTTRKVAGDVAAVMGEALFVLDQRRVILDTNPAARTLLRRTESSLQGMPFDNLLTLEASQTDGVPPDTGVHRLTGRDATAFVVTGDGTAVPVLLNVTPIGTRGPTKGFVVLVHDISRRVAAETAMKLNEARLSALHDLGYRTFGSEDELIHHALEQAVHLTGSELGYFVFVNDGTVDPGRTTWCHADESLEPLGNAPSPKECGFLWDPVITRQKPLLDNAVSLSPDTPAPAGLPALRRHMSVPLRDSNRAIALIGVCNKHEHYDTADIRQLELFVNSLWGIIQRMRSEEAQYRMQHEMEQIQRVERLGHLAGTIAHEFNNLLGAAQGFVSMADSSADKEDLEGVRKRLKRARSVFDQMKKLTAQLLTFSKGGAPQRSRNSLSALLNTTVQQAGENQIDCSTEIPDDLWDADVDAEQVALALDGLIVNAHQAMDGNGSVRVRARNVGPEEFTHDVLPAGPYVAIEIQDSGCGIPRDILRRVFDPFFTTRPLALGLGLSIAYSVARRHQGDLSLDTTEGTGTTCTLLLPALTEVAVTATT